jgi:hypothetical protein
MRIQVLKPVLVTLKIGAERAYKEGSVRGREEKGRSHLAVTRRLRKQRERERRGFLRTLGTNAKGSTSSAPDPAVSAIAPPVS